MRNDGDGMIILDGTYEYETDYIDGVLAKSERDSIERTILNAFSRHAYYLYTRIRDCVTSRKCKKLSIEVVRVRLAEEHHFIFTSTNLKINREQINYILNFVENIFPAAIR